MPDEGASVLPHDETPPGLLDYGTAAGFHPFATLRAQLVDVPDIARSGLGLLKAFWLTLLLPAPLKWTAARLELLAGCRLSLLPRCGLHLLTRSGLPPLLVWRGGLLQLIGRNSPYALRALALRCLALRCLALLGLPLLLRLILLLGLPLRLTLLRWQTLPLLEVAGSLFLLRSLA